MPRCALGLFHLIDLALLQPPQQLVGRDVHHHHFVGVIEHLVRHRLSHLDADNAAHHVVEAFKMLHVERGPHVNARIQQLIHVHPALGMARTRHVAVREFIEQQHIGMPRQRRVDVEFLELLSLVRHVGQRQQLQVVQLLRGLRAAVGLHKPHQHGAPILPLALRRRQHGVGLAHPGVRSEIDAQLAAARTRLLFLQAGHQRVGVRARAIG
ncbi:hypothetical protein SDC9_107861 [bioreactor metagenome]|uniref:Uncharacterized protein n=1 Tax=bioreactor metagenome TaxID=1076179 RepID=A0A645B6G9_9ZZZZ